MLFNRVLQLSNITIPLQPHDWRWLGPLVSLRRPDWLLSYPFTYAYRNILLLQYSLNITTLRHPQLKLAVSTQHFAYPSFYFEQQFNILSHHHLLSPLRTSSMRLVPLFLSIFFFVFSFPFS